jgi:hypothetical protein
VVCPCVILRSAATKDLGALLSAWGSQVGDPDWNPDADLDRDGEVGHSDLGILLGDWGCRVP